MHATPLRCSRSNGQDHNNIIAMSLPCHCHAIAMPLPCYCHAIAMPLPCYCHAIAMLLPCHCHAIAMPLPCYCAIVVMRLPCYFSYSFLVAARPAEVVGQNSRTDALHLRHCDYWTPANVNARDAAGAVGAVAHASKTKSLAVCLSELRWAWLLLSEETKT